MSRDEAELTRAEVGALIGVSADTITSYRQRYAGTDNPFPEPDRYVRHRPRWNAQRARREVPAWNARRTGRTGRPKAQHEPNHERNAA